MHLDVPSPLADATLEPAHSLQKWVCTLLSLAGVAGIAAIDSLTSFEVSLSFFYAIPVIFSVWFVGRWIGALTALVGVASWALADQLSGHHYSSEWIPFWNVCVRFSFLMLIVAGAYYARQQLQQSRSRTAALEQALPVCTCCKKIRDEDGAWLDLETYAMERLSTHPAPKLCPDCAKRVYIQKVSPQEPGTTRA